MLLLLIAVMLLSMSIVALSASLGLVNTTDKAVRERLARISGATVTTARRMRQMDAPTGLARWVLPGAMLARIRRNLVLAGHPAGWSIRNILAAKLLIPAALGLFSAQFLLFEGRPVLAVLGVVSIVVGYFTPDLLVSSRATERQGAMQRSLPDVLDKIVISIEAGLGFEAGLARAAEAAEGPLSDELRRIIQDVRLGVARRTAYEAMQQRTSSEDIISFIRSVMQAEQHGSSMSSMVRIQAKEMRTRRRLRAEEKAGRVSVQLLGPLMLCIFPVLFIVLLGPAVLNILNTV